MTSRKIQNIRFIILLSVFIAYIPVSEAVEIDRIAAIVNDEIITIYDIAQNYFEVTGKRLSHSLLNEDIGRNELENLLEPVIEQTLLKQEVKRKNIRVTEKEIEAQIEQIKRVNNLGQGQLEDLLKGQGISYEEYKNQIREEYAIAKLVEIEVRSGIDVSDDMIRSYYHRNRKKYAKKESVRLRHIFFASPTEEDETKKGRVREKAFDVYHKLKGGEDFIRCANRYSDDKLTAADGGDLGFISKGDFIPEIENIIFNMKEGEISEPIRSARGFHIIKLEQKIPADVKPLDDVKEEIRQRVYENQYKKRLKRWVKDLKERANIERRIGN